MYIYFCSGLGPDFIPFESSGSGFYLCSPVPGPDFINCESRSQSGFHSGRALGFIHFSRTPGN